METLTLPNILLLGLITLTGYITYIGERQFDFKDKYMFWVDRILIGKEYIRLISSGFLHMGWMHFSMNMFVLYVFGELAMALLGILPFFVLYFASLLGGSLLSLYFHRQHGDYTAVGASGAVSGILYGYILLVPTGGIGMIFVPDLAIPAWIYGLLYLVVTLSGVKLGWGNIGHEAHLGGSITGLLITAAFAPQLVLQNWWVLLLLLIPFCGFMWLSVYRPEFLLVDNYFGNKKKDFTATRTQQRKAKAVERYISQEAELNALLDKVRTSGIGSLTERERKRLDELSAKL